MVSADKQYLDTKKSLASNPRIFLLKTNYIIIKVPANLRIVSKSEHKSNLYDTDGHLKWF